MSSKKLILNSSRNFEIIDITSMINDEIDIKSGIVNIFSKHSTSAIVVNENESGLLNDLELTGSQYFLSNLMDQEKIELLT